MTTLAAAGVALLAAPATRAAFPGSDGRIMAVQYGQFVSFEADGADFVGPSSITPQDGSYHRPTVSADGQRVFGFHEAGSSATGVWSMRPDGFDRKQVTHTPTDWYVSPSPDGMKLVVADGWSRLSVVTLSAAGVELSRVDLPALQPGHADSLTGISWPEFSPDGARIAFTAIDESLLKRSNDIYVINTDGTGERRLVRSVYDDVQPSWKPDGSEIAFASDRATDRSYDLYAVTPAATPAVRRITRTTWTDYGGNNGGDESQPSYSPDGTSIVYSAARPDDSGAFLTIPAGGGAPASTGQEGRTPRWLPFADAEPWPNAPCTITTGTPRGDGLVMTGTSRSDVICGTEEADAISGGGGNDIIRAGGGGDSVKGGAGDDWIDGGDGNDTMDGGGQADFFHGGAGSDTLTYALRTAGVSVALPAVDVPGASLAAPARLNGANEGDEVFTDVENVVGGSGGNSLRSYQPTTANRLVGGDGPDWLAGGGGNDTLLGGYDEDNLYGEAGSDAIDGGFGPDKLSGGSGPKSTSTGADLGTDALGYANRTEGVSVTPNGIADDGDLDERDDVAGDFERITGTPLDDFLQAADHVKTTLIGRAGKDTLVGGKFTADVLQGGLGADVLNSYSDGIKDTDQCGTDATSPEPGDVANADATDLVATDCEQKNVIAP
ncbi:MAG TPA: hypothetical protein VF533_15210 [Solirubrobacteraceae bacterium]